jgi:RES domain-containing protein
LFVERRARDLELLDLLEKHKGVSFEGEAWRIVRDGREPLIGYPAGARWDPATFDVIYTSTEREGALEEIHFHLGRQPVFPSKIRSVVYRISVRTRRTLRIADAKELAALGIAPEAYRSISYQRTQEVGDAAAFLGFDSILAPSARWPCQNLVLFTERFAPQDLTAISSEPVDWDDWRKRRESERRKRER